ncbi:hypothetical protein [Paenibacillus sp. V4I7]|uniref:hypothetical protein n=1 Tax=Paenibacillus sp. V4I7 TaxID=3042307 RepID=UPI00277D9660|nr:hypothetical protein [Paenibacillus sp. V4I7]MDQ0899909.1 hypothetical protein [Paenibacillus sp. V4I7]
MKFNDLMAMKDIYLDSISEPRDNFLCLTFSRSKTSLTPETIKIGEKEINDVFSMDIDYKLPLIKLEFEWYIGYSIINESFTVLDDYEEYEGRVFRIYNKSRYLDFIQMGSIATEDYPGPFKHYGIICLNHIVDIVSASEPIVSEVERK